MLAFSKMKINLFDWSDLNGKTLEITVAEHNGSTVVMGRDVKGEDIFILHEDISTKAQAREDI